MSKKNDSNAGAETLHKILKNKRRVEDLTNKERLLILESQKGSVGRFYEAKRALIKSELAEEDDSRKASAMATAFSEADRILDSGLLRAVNLSESDAAKAKARHKEKIEKSLLPLVSRLINSNPSIKDAEIVRELLKKNPSGSQINDWLKRSDNKPYSIAGLRPYVYRLAGEVRAKMRR